MQRQLAAPGNRVALHRGDGRMRAALERREGVFEAVRFHRSRLALRRELAQVEPRAERRSGSLQDDHADIVPPGYPLKRRVQGLHHRRVERVPLLGTVERDGTDLVFDGAEDVVRHASAA